MNSVHLAVKMIHINIHRGRALRIAVGITMLMLVLAGGAGATKIIKDNATGGDCTSFGIWSAATKTCTMTTDLTSQIYLNGIEIVSNGVTLDGNGHTITGSGGYGVSLAGRSGVLVKNLNVKQFQYGVYLTNSNNNYLIGINASDNNIGISVSGNNNTMNGINVSNNIGGIMLGSSSNNTLSSINANYNRDGGISLTSSSNNTLSGISSSNNNGNGIVLGYSNSNTLSGINVSYNKGNGIILSSSNSNTLNSINANSNRYYSTPTTSTGNGIKMYTSSNNILNDINASTNVGTGIDVSGSNNILSNNNANSNNNYGIYLIGNNNELNDNNVSNNSEGIYLSSSSSNILSGNNANSNKNSGILLDNSRNNILNGNNANSNTKYGIFLSSTGNFTYNNTLSGNNASSNTDYGLYLLSSNSNTLSGNNASNNYYGIYISSSSNNTIYNNFFINNNNFESSLSVNKWNTTKTPGMNIIGGPYLGGNLWANPGGTGFSQTCADSNSDGICDSPYTLASSNIDYLPLAYKFTSTPIANVSISGNSFQPQTINISAGTTVTWTNLDPVAHTVTSDTGLFDSGSLSTGQTFSRIFNTNGSYDYHCSIHPSMTGSVIVTSDNPPPASISNPQASRGTTWINWSWNNPLDTDFSHVMLYLNGSFITIVYSPQNYYNATGLLPNTSYELGTHTVDTSGNINQTWVNKTARTAPIDGTPVEKFPGMTNPPTDPDGDGLYEDINGNGMKDFNDVVLFFNYLEWIPDNEPIISFDFNGNGRIDFNDIIKLFEEL